MTKTIALIAAGLRSHRTGFGPRVPDSPCEVSGVTRVVGTGSYAAENSRANIAS